MTGEREGVARPGIQLWFEVEALAGLTDAELIGRFVAGGDPAEFAFAALVARHGPMVLRACHAALRDRHAAEDAFQATFLVLARRSGSLWVSDSLGPWLHRVASRVSSRARAMAARRAWHERQAAQMTAEVRMENVPDDLGPAVHAEVDRLPARFRGPVILCDLEGRTHEEAALQLGCPIGTVKSRLARARERLRIRFERRGLIPPAAGLGALFVGQSACAVPPTLAITTIQLARPFAVREASAVRSVPTHAIVLAEGVLKMMSLQRLMIPAIALLFIVIATASVVALPVDRPRVETAPPATAATVPTPLIAAPIPPEKLIPKELQEFQGVWVIGLCDTVNKSLYASNEELAKKWRWTVKGDEITWVFKGEEWKLAFKVDPSKKPKEFDFTYLSGPYKGEKCLGMYDWGGVDGKSLQIAIQDPGATKPRPTELRMSGTSQNALIFLRRTEAVDPKKELAAFQGIWSFENVMTDTAWSKPLGKVADKNGQGGERKWTVKENEITWTSLDGQEIKASFTIDPNKVPRHIDMTFLSGPNKGQKCLGVYEWTGGELWLCIADPGREIDRPKDISYSTNQGRSWIFLIRYLTPVEKEQRLLQGVWKFEVCESECWPVNRPTTKEEFPKWRWTVKGNEMNWTGVSTGDVKVSFSVDPAKSPKEMDLTFLDGPHKGEKCLGIYKLKSGSLWVCVQDPGAKQANRPTDFSAGTSTGRSLLIFDVVDEKKK